MPELAIVGALEREIRPLVRNWRVEEREYGGRRWRFYHSGNCVAVCAGIGPEAARRATEAIISLYRPAVVQSVGFAGALDGSLRVGQVIEVRQVVDAKDNSRTDTGSGSETLISFPSIAGAEQKARLAQSYQAQAVDMEAASVAKAAEARGVRFGAIKVISDEVAFPMPAMERFISGDGGFQSGRFALHAAARPWLWVTLLRLARNSKLASNRLSAYLEKSVGRAQHASVGMGS
jgi:adenosylhomocysteine nucleosidase